MSTEAPRRTTGPRSQNRIIHGWCQDIADRLTELVAPTPKALVYQIICLDAVEEGVIPMRRDLWRAVPEHESRWSTAQAADVATLIERRVTMLVAQYDKPFYLTVYDESGRRQERRWVKP